MTLDFFLFYVFWEVMLVPMYFLIGIWGGPRQALRGDQVLPLHPLRIGPDAARHHHRSTSTTRPECSASGPRQRSDVRHPDADGADAGMPVHLQILLFFAFFFGFAIKVPMFPFHTWLPDAHVEAPTAGSVILAGVLLKMGTYGFVRFSLPMFPKAVPTHWVLILMAALSIVGIIYGAMVSLVQKDMKKLVAYSSVSHLGFVMLGVFALNPAGISGAILQMVNHGISTGALFLLVGIVYERRHTRMISDYGGLAKTDAGLRGVLPHHGALLDGACRCLNGFVGEFTILNGAYLPQSVVGLLRRFGESCSARPIFSGSTSGSFSASCRIRRTRS